MGIKDKLRDLPDSPGVYLMKDAKGKVLYIGKAKNLSKRVGSYFQEGRPKTIRHMLLLEQVKDISYIESGSEEEALLYEANLIKQKKPRYNVELKDDKSFPYLKVTVKERFPRLLITRKKVNDGSIYFGPYTHVKLLRRAHSILKGIFPLRVCKRMPKDVCLAYHIGQCLGPCVGKIRERGYREIVKELTLFLEGKKRRLIKELSKKMEGEAKKERFEEALIIRNRIASLSEVSDVKMRDYSGWGQVALKLKRLLRLPWLPFRIEVFDVSNIAGREASGSMVYFYNGGPDKSNYRKFKIKSVLDIDDYAMIREIVGRRYRRLKEEGGSYPDLIIIDGGRGHLKVAYEELLKLNLKHIPIIAIAKSEDWIYTLGSTKPISINKDSEVIHFIQKMRDEAHRFALKYHHKLREKKIFLHTGCAKM